MLKTFTEFVVLQDYVQKFGNLGINHVQNMINNRCQLHGDVHRAMAGEGVFDNHGISSVFAKNWAKRSVSEFFRDKNFGWAKARINHYADEIWKPLKQRMISAGHKDDTPEGLENKTSMPTNLLLWGGVAVVGLVVLKKMLSK
jgi:hypothetical protein